MDDIPPTYLATYILFQVLKEYHKRDQYAKLEIQSHLLRGVCCLNGWHTKFFICLLCQSAIQRFTLPTFSPLSNPLSSRLNSHFALSSFRFNTYDFISVYIVSN